MEKPTGTIQKIIESLQRINTLDVYSPIEKDTILHYLRAAYMNFLNISTDENIKENRVGILVIEEKTESETYSDLSEMEEEPQFSEEPLFSEAPLVAEEPQFSEEPLFSEAPLVVEEPQFSEEPLFSEAPLVAEEPQFSEEPLFSEAPLVAEEPQFSEDPLFSEAPLVVEEPQFSEEPLFSEAPLVEKKVLYDDLLEFIPDAKPQSGLLFEETAIIKSEKKSLNDLLTEKKEDHSLGVRFQQSYIPDLTKAIAINEKFTFIRELFRNSGVEFSAAIQKLNECKNIDAAFILMEELKHKYLWDTTSTSYLSLCDLVRRRFL